MYNLYTMEKQKKQREEKEKEELKKEKYREKFNSKILLKLYNFIYILNNIQNKLVICIKIMKIELNNL